MREQARHPVGLAVLYLTEVWERFSFYGLKSLLVLYLTSGVLELERFDKVIGSHLVLVAFGHHEGDAASVQGLASQINEVYSGFAYLTPLIGGVLADRLLGTRPTLILGGLLMAAGHACMAFEATFLIGLVLLVLGNGGFKPTITALLSRLYEQPGLSSLRDRGFAIFYTGINVGALLAPLICGTLQMYIGYDAGFGAAGVGMAVGLATFLLGSSHLPREERIVNVAAGEPLLSTPIKAAVPRVATAVRSVGWPWHSMAALLSLCGLVIPFWVAFEQFSNTVPLFFRDLTERSVWGYTVPAAWLQSLSPLFCVSLMPVVAALWTAQARRGVEPAACTKMAIGSLLQALSWAFMTIGSLGVTSDSKATLMLPIVATACLTAGQIYLAPVGLALVSRSCPPHAKSIAVGFWFLGGGVGGLLAAPIGALYSRWSHPEFFALLCLLCLAGAVLLGVAGPRLQRIAASSSTEAGEAQHKRHDLGAASDSE
mmetsp:Transcript_44694/g.117168  ORF Transcript_44694/g.117168 Transcript_44694/m.117168 type:complete len:485 (+) Transcript_44694:21-1475(+)